MTVSRYGIPYQGSKGRFAARIYRTIAHRHPDAHTLIDPFCGGWAVSLLLFASCLNRCRW